MEYQQLLLILAALLFVNHGFDFFIKKFELCDLNINYPIKFYASFRKHGKNQILDGNGTLSIPFDDTLNFSLVCEVLVGKKYVQVYTMREPEACSKLHKYAGEFAYDLERAAQIIPGTCPIRKGKYRIQNLVMNFNKITFQAFPFGELRLTLNYIDRNNQIVSCVLALVDNTV